MKLLLEQITITDTTGWTGPFSAGDIARIDATKYDKGVYTKDGKTTYWYKEKGSGGGGGVKPPAPQACPVPANDVIPFQKWLDKTQKPWYNGGQFNEIGGPYGICGNATKAAWSNTTWRTEYQNSGSSNASGGSGQNLENRGYNPDVVKFAKEIIFFDDAGRSIKKFDASLNEDFDSDGEVNRALKIATNLVPNRKMTPYSAYIFAVNYVLLERGVNIGSIEVPKEYQKDLPQGTIIENLVLKPLIGLINLLTEQDRVRISIDTDDGTKKIGTVVTTRKTNIGFTCNLQNPLKFDAWFPDEDPLIGMVKDKLNVGQGEDEIEENIFTAALADAIIKYRTDKGLAYSRNKGYIDTELVRELFSERCKPTAGSTPLGTPSGTATQGLSLRNFGFREVLERANSILSEASSNLDLYFKDCQYIFDEYPKVARNASTTYLALPKDRKPDINKMANSAELKNIKDAITYCATKRKGKTKLSMTFDKLNIFKRGIKSIMELPTPWRMSENEIFKGSQINLNNMSSENNQDRTVRVDKLGNTKTDNDFLTDFFGLTLSERNKPIETRINRLVKTGDYLEFNALVGESEDFEKLRFDCETKQIYGSIEDEDGDIAYSLSDKGFKEFKNYCKTIG